jgi:hypothetical protein
MLLVTQIVPVLLEGGLRFRNLANRRRREGHWQPTSVTVLGGILVGDGRVAAGASELGPAMSDGESGFPANYSRSWPTIIRDYSRRPRRGRAHAPDSGAAEPGLRSHWPRIKVGSGNLNRGRRQLKPEPRTWTKASVPVTRMNKTSGYRCA